MAFVETTIQDTQVLSKKDIKAGLISKKKPHKTKGISPFLLRKYVFRKDEITLGEKKLIERFLKTDPQSRKRYERLLDVYNSGQPILSACDFE